MNIKQTKIINKEIKVAILAEEPLGWGSGKNYFPAILDGYKWKAGNTTYIIKTQYIFDKEIIKGKLNIINYDLLLVPGGGVGDSESIIKGLIFNKNRRKWRKIITKFIEDGGGYVGICGGTALITDLSRGKNNKLESFLERQYNRSAIGVSSVTSYYKDIAWPLFYPFQLRYPEKIGATGYVFSFKPGVTIDGDKIFSGGVPIDFHINKNNPIFSDYPRETERIRWWGGPALLVPQNPNREVTILAKYPKKDLSEMENTKILAWRYTGGITGLFISLFKAFKFIKNNNDHLKNLLMYTYYLAGNWTMTDKLIELNFSDKACMTSEIYPNKNKGRIILCTAHPEYMIWWGGKIVEGNSSDFNCIGHGFHQWKNIESLSNGALDEFTHSWWIVRRMIAWAAKVPDDDMPPIIKGEITESGKKILSNEIYWDGTLLHQMKNI